MSAKRRVTSLVASLAGIALLATACTGTAEPAETGALGGGDDPFAQMEPLELTFNQTNPAGGHFEAANVAFTTYIEEATKGKVTFNTLYSGSLLPVAEAFSGVGSGVADVSYTTTFTFENQFPIADWLSPAMSADPQPYPLGDLVNYAAANDFIANEPALQAEYEALNVKPLWFISASPGDMLCTEPIEDLDDAKGRLTRSGSARLSQELAALDMTPVSMPFADLYEGLQRGAIDCVYTTAGNTTFKPYGLTEVAKNYAPVNGWTPVSALGYVINLDLWNSFPEELQQVFHEASIQAMRTHAEGAFEVIAEFGATAEKDGVAFLETDEIRGVFADLHEELIAGLADEAPASVENPDELIESLGQYRAKWRDLLAESVVKDLPENAPVDGEGLRKAFAESGDLIDWDAFLALLKEQDAVAG